MDPDELKKNTLKTRISQAFWCQPNTNGDFDFHDASFPDPDEKEKIYWFDQILEGGIWTPQPDMGQAKPLLFLLTGPPGSGKTTLALEMCYRLAKKQIGGKYSLYLSAEGEGWKLQQRANRYGWDENRFVPISFDPTENQEDFQNTINKLDRPGVLLWGARSISEAFKKPDNTNTLEKKVSSLFTRFGPFIGRLLKVSPKFLEGTWDADAISTTISSLKMIVNEVQKKENQQKETPLQYDFESIVIDSLNVLPDEQSRSRVFNSLITNMSEGPKVIIVILDSESSDTTHKYWEHICDILVRLDSHYETKYLIRTIEVVKARFQPHVWGKHQLKIYPGSDEKKLGKRAHPYRKEGGIFIYPSIHWFLSRYKRKQPHISKPPIETPLEHLNKILSKDPAETTGGLPGGRCTAFMGSRGAHKSHIGYYHILNRILNHQEPDCHERGLIISLRDDEGLANDAMTGLLATLLMAKKHLGLEKKEAVKEARKTLEKYEREDDLEILFFPPGYITPEEFYHRVLMSLLRLKVPQKTGEQVHVTVLFNSLDQLSARFPLCAKEDVFIPGLIDTFMAESVTSMFIAVDEPGQPEHQYGLLTMADLILTLHQHSFEAKDYFGHLSPDGKNIDPALKEEFGKKIQTVVLHVKRFAGGQRAGEGGILELVQKENLVKLYTELFSNEPPRLIFTPFNPQYEQGKPLSSRSHLNMED